MILAKPRIFLSAMIGLMFGVLNLCFAMEGQENLEFYGSASLQSGQYKNFKYRKEGYELTNKWMQDNILTMGIRSQINNRLSGDVSLKAWLFFNPFPDSLMKDVTKDMNAPTIDFYMMSARMKLRLSPDPEDSLFNLEIGLFPFKYNEEVRNLGEYLFRTGCYPGYIYSEGFDLAGTQLSGIHLRNTLFDGVIKNDLFFTSELYLYPAKDFSLTLLTDISPVENRVIDFGLGLQLFRFLSVDDAYTTPTKYESLVGSGAEEQKPAPNWYLTESGDTAYYTFAGTKIMGRLAFDPKSLFGSPDIFGSEDLKLYSEAIILGVKNYPANLDSSNINYPHPINEFGFNKLMEKMPIMAGFNFPAFKLLDVLSLEVEYYGKKYVNRVPIYANSQDMMRLPLPYDPKINQGYPNGDTLFLPEASGAYSKDTYKKGAAQWKWSVYAKRTLFEKFTFTMQAARDHTLIKTGLAQNVDFEEIFIKNNQWYWMMKFGYSF